jgi:hypothetical protein
MPASPHFEQARISRVLRECPNGFLPGRCVWELFSAADESKALAEFWLDIARISDWPRAGWVPALRRTATLGGDVPRLPLSDEGIIAD